jgi:5-methyltetrahydropteroyltriglutamate--homocysteine methyltransferase
LKVGCYIGGIYPRSDRLIEATRRSPPNLPEIFRRDKKRVIDLQIRAGLTYVSDPLLDWSDMLRPYLALKGVEQGALNRVFEQNTFYRMPVVVDRVEWVEPITLKNLSLDLLPKGRGWKVDLPDPYTFAQLSDNRYYRDRRDLILDLAKALAKEAETLQQHFKLIQINAPSICSVRSRDELELAYEALRTVTRGLSAKTYLHLYFGDPTPILSDLLDFPVSGLGLDLVNTKIPDGLRFGKMGLAAGCVDAGNTKMEKPEKVAEEVKRVVDAVEPSELYICPNYDLEYVPRAYANRKVLRLSKIAKLLEEEMRG